MNSVTQTVQNGSLLLIQNAEERHVLIFKTNLRSKKDLKLVAQFLLDCPQLIRWNVDLDDCDKILRIESSSNQTTTIIIIMHKAGFFCEELGD